MNGHILQGTKIAVDYWKIQGRCEGFVHFLTHLHGDHIVGLTSSWQQPIYCSEFTAELLRSKYGLREFLVRICPLNQSIIVPETISKSFTVTTYDADHCPGAVMFFFQGEFGNILYTGDFRSSPQVLESCKNLIRRIDTLYLDNTFCSPKCVFPSRDDCLTDIIRIIRQHPQHQVLIGVRKLGKELLLAKLGVALNETICVSPTCYQISQMLFTTNVFTTVALNDDKSRVRTVPIHLISRKFLENLNRTRQTIAIIPSAIYTGLDCQPFCRDENIFVVPYSDHSNFQELFEFVSTMKPNKVLPIVRQFRGPFGICLSAREDMTCFQSVLSKDSPERNMQIYNSCRKKVLYCKETSNIESCLQITDLAQESDINCDNLTARSCYITSVSNHEHIFSLQRKRKHWKDVPRHIKSTTKGVVYVDPISDSSMGFVSNNKQTGFSDITKSISRCYKYRKTSASQDKSQLVMIRNNRVSETDNSDKNSDKVENVEKKPDVCLVINEQVVIQDDAAKDDVNFCVIRSNNSLSRMCPVQQEDGDTHYHGEACFVSSDEDNPVPSGCQCNDTFSLANLATIHNVDPSKLANFNGSMINNVSSDLTNIDGDMINVSSELINIDSGLIDNVSSEPGNMDGGLIDNFSSQLINIDCIIDNVSSELTNIDGGLIDNVSSELTNIDGGLIDNVSSELTNIDGGLVDNVSSELTNIGGGLIDNVGLIDNILSEQSVDDTNDSSDSKKDINFNNKSVCNDYEVVNNLHASRLLHETDSSMNSTTFPCKSHGFIFKDLSCSSRHPRRHDISDRQNYNSRKTNDFIVSLQTFLGRIRR